MGKGLFICRNFDRIYLCTNEQLLLWQRMKQFKDATVLSVMGSSDQLFSAYFMGAKYVDTFDINDKTLYYFYLRKYTIQFLKEMYPCYQADSGLNYIDRELLKKIINNLEHNKRLKGKELEAFLFWKQHINDCHDLCQREYRGSVPFSKIEDIPERALGKPFFAQADLFSESFVADLENGFHRTCENSYDIVIVSNILETKPEYNLPTARDNLYRVLKPNGIVLCGSWTNDIDTEKLIFDSKFYFNGTMTSDNYYSYYYTKIPNSNLKRERKLV